ncbi:IclR family transcriptional regulator domain-containing protein, partial [Comamonas thiooxydans]
RLTQSTPASARRSLSTLVQLGYLESDGKLFWMQPKSLLIAYSFLSSRPMPALAQPLLDALSERTRESASLGTLLEDDAIIIGRSTARRSLSTGLGIGSRLPVYCSAIGRMLLSGLPQQEARARLEMIERVALTPHTVTDLEELLG